MKAVEDRHRPAPLLVPERMRSMRPQKRSGADQRHDHRSVCRLAEGRNLPLAYGHEIENIELGGLSRRGGDRRAPMMRDLVAIDDQRDLPPIAEAKVMDQALHNRA